jgi:hypothetical protein
MPKSVFALKERETTKAYGVLELPYQSVSSSLHYIGMEW